MKIKKILAFACALCLFGGTYSAVPDFEGSMSVSAEEAQTSGVLTYVNYGDYIEITGCDREFSGDLIIPKSIDGVPVTSIGDEAFYECTSLTSVNIPDSVTSIVDSAFEGCTSLASVIIPDSVTSIGEYVFYQCESLTSVTIPDSVVSIGYRAFLDCTSLASIDIAETNENYCSIDGVLFDRNATTLIQYPAGKNNDEYSIPDSVTSIGDYAFGACTTLYSVTIGDNVTSIGESAFADCTSLASVIIPDSVKSIGSFAFRSCESLVSIVIPEGVTSIEERTFLDCTSLASITIPDSITNIGDGAFSNCMSLASITIPDGTKSIGEWAFGFCTSLTSVTIPDSVNSIMLEAFNHCTNLKSITINNPECYIDWSNIPLSTTIYGYENSTAQAYAERNGNKFVPITKKIIYGDADGSGDVTLADAVSIVSYIADSERYPLGSYDAADVCNRGDGINASDAISVQNFLLGKITSLPESVIEL